MLDVKTIALNVRDLFRFITSTLAALRILGTTKPDVVFSKGGFVALPVGVAAHLKHIPIVTHDSDSVPGLANRVLGRWSKVRTSGVPAGHSKHYVGNLIDSNLEKVSPNAQAASKEQLGLSSDSLVLLIAGGSSGALDINNIVTSIAERLLNSNNQLYLIHIAGSYDFVEVEQKYRATLNPDLLKRVKIYDFVNNFNELSAAADLIISRAGANAIAEFATQGKACILIPNPALAGGHQVKNAEILQASGAVEIVANNTTPENLFNVTNDLLQNKQRREELSRKIYTDKHKTAATELAKLLLHEAS